MKILKHISLAILLALVCSCSAETGSKKHSVSNHYLKLNISSDLSMLVLNKSNQKEYSISKPEDFVLNNVESINGSCLLHCLYLPDSAFITVSVSLQDSTLSFQLIADSLTAISDRMYFPGPIAVKSEESFVVPYATGILMPASDSLFMDEFDFWKHGSTMSFVGVTNMQSSYMLTSADPWDTGVRFKNTSDASQYEVQVFHEPSKGTFAYKRTLHYTFIANGDYVEMSKFYRSFAEERGYVKTLREKAAKNPNVNKLIGAVDFWILRDQFRRPAFIHELGNFGVDKALFSLSGGWYTPGDYSQLIDTINALGYLSSRYDLLTDVWPPEYPEMKQFRTSGFPDEVVVDANDSLYKGWVAYPRKDVPFQGYIICSQTHPEYIDRRLARELPSMHYNARFMDVELSLHLLECYSPLHPTSRHKDALNRIETLKVVQEKHSLVCGSEEAYDWAFQALDFSEGTMSVRPEKNASYNWVSPVDKPDADFIKYNLNPELKIPLHGLVYHDVHVPTWYTGDGVSKVPAYWDDKDLFNLLYGTMPLFLPPSPGYWEQHREKFLTSYHLVASLFNEVGFAKMTDHQMLTADKQLQFSSFDNAWEVFVNFGESAYTLDDRSLPSKGFYASDGKSEVSRLTSEEGELACACLPGKLFMNPYGQTQSYRGIRSNGSVVAVKHDAFIQIAFIGDETHIDINPDHLPWPIASIRVYSDNVDEVPVEALDSGWFRLEKQGNNRFYKIKSD